MFIIFGTRALKHTIDNSEILKNSCPNCSNGNLVNKRYRRWFTLFFIPVIPLNEIDRFYECDKCNSGYQNDIKKILQESQVDQSHKQEQAKSIFVSALIATMTHMALIDNDYAKEEEREIKDTINNFPEFKEHLMEIHESVKNQGNNDNYVFNLLNEARNLFPSEAMLNLLAQAAVILLADGTIEKEEEELMKEYLIACGLPKEFYQVLIDKLQKQALISEANISLN